MRTRHAMFALAAVIATASCAGNGPGRERGWVMLGQREVSDRLDHDVISVTAARNDYRRIKIIVERHGVDFQRVIVHYFNGGEQEVALRSSIGAGGETRPIDLNGGNRLIRSVEFWYDARTAGGRKALVKVFALR